MAFCIVVPLLVLGLFNTGPSEMIQTQKSKIAALGEDAHLYCQLTQSKDVFQVTWQKILPDRKRDLATYSKRFPPRVNSPFEGKVEFQFAGLQSCSIVIRKVTEQDESCYRCLFHTYPEGAFTAITCLRVYEQYEPVLHITRSNSTEESLVSCSATGRPAPAVTLIDPERDLSSSQSDTVSVHNPNGTVTVTVNASTILSGLHGNNTQVGCVVRQFSLVVMKVFKTIPENNQASTVGVVDTRARTAAVIVVALVVVVPIVFCIWRIKKKRSNKEAENVKTLQTPTKEPQEKPEGETLLRTPEEPQDRSHRQPEEETMLQTPTEETQEDPEEEVTPQTPAEEESNKEAENVKTLQTPTKEPQEKPEGETLLRTPEEPQESHRQPEEETMLQTRTEETQEDPEEEVTPQTPAEEESHRKPEGKMTLVSPTQEPHEGMNNKNNKKEEIREGSTPWDNNEKSSNISARRALWKKNFSEVPDFSL